MFVIFVFILTLALWQECAIGAFFAVSRGLRGGGILGLFKVVVVDHKVARSACSPRGRSVAGLRGSGKVARRSFVEGVGLDGSKDGLPWAAQWQ